MSKGYTEITNSDKAQRNWNTVSNSRKDVLLSLHLLDC